jgi:hypothetical protein
LRMKMKMKCPRLTPRSPPCWHFLWSTSKMSWVLHCWGGLVVQARPEACSSAASRGDLGVTAIGKPHVGDVAVAGQEGCFWPFPCPS